jgi:hypothetical protein
MTLHTLEHIAEQLARHHQRATYGAVAAALGQAPRALMQGQQRAPRFSWIVSSQNHQPTGYAPEQKDPSLEERKEVLATKDALLAWLDNPR